ncbi:hypothetical protein P4562_05180 [Lysinibacillus xylanilyticus]|uniref:hypothetical protein n=1 Tax=Lysinibacillus xylanilyticus TaxID=582475 RepID=UPI002E1A7514|nr:hypothetical protein [Lysinibacillus xylanilyticus]
MYRVIFVILIAIMLDGCNKPIAQPEGKVIVNSENYLMMPGDYQWKEKEVEIKTLSSLDINGLADAFETLEVGKGDTIKFEIDQNPTSILVTKLNEDGTNDNVEVKDNKLTMPMEDGYYIYVLKATWNKGKETFVFDVNVK